MKKIVVVDIDLTVADSQWRTDRLRNLNRVPTNEDFRIFWAPGAEHDPVIMRVVSLVNALHLFGHRIVFVTARPDSMEAITNKWLHDVFTFKIELIMRASDDLRAAPELKFDMVKTLGLENVYCCIEDDLEVTKYFREKGLFVLQVL